MNTRQAYLDKRHDAPIPMNNVPPSPPTRQQIQQAAAWLDKHKRHDAPPATRDDAILAATYQATLLARGLVDFNDMLQMSRDLLERCDQTRAQIMSTFTHLLVDEFQDSNPVQVWGVWLQVHCGFRHPVYSTPPQVALISLLQYNRGNVTAVGDDAQSIYGFRGASAHAFGAFRKHFPILQQCLLQHNYRSRPSILLVAQHMLRHCASLTRKDLMPDKADGGMQAVCLWERGVLGYHRGTTMHNHGRHHHPFHITIGTEASEAAAVAQEIQRLVKEQGVPYAHIACLFRSFRVGQVSVWWRWRNNTTLYEVVGCAYIFLTHA